jgi:hypothetical protein
VEAIAPQQQSSLFGKRDANHMHDALLHNMDGSELSRVRTESDQLRNIANCFASSSTVEQRVFWSWPLWQIFLPGASSDVHTDVAGPSCARRLLAMLRLANCLPALQSSHGMNPV